MGGAAAFEVGVRGRVPSLARGALWGVASLARGVRGRVPSLARGALSVLRELVGGCGV